MFLIIDCELICVHSNDVKFVGMVPPEMSSRNTLSQIVQTHTLVKIIGGDGMSDGSSDDGGVRSNVHTMHHSD